VLSHTRELPHTCQGGSDRLEVVDLTRLDGGPREFDLPNPPPEITADPSELILLSDDWPHLERTSRSPPPSTLLNWRIPMPIGGVWHET